MKSNKKIYIWLPLCIALSIGLGVFIGNRFSKFNIGRGLFYTGGNKIQSVLDYIDKAYVDTVNVDNLVEEAIPTILEGLDPHSAYITAEEMALTGTELDGHFSGIGVEFIVQNDTVAIVNVISGGPSEAVGIMPGDRIVYVNDSLFVTKNMSNEKVFRHLRGAKNTTVKLGIKRGTDKKILDFTVTRADVPVKSVDASYKIENKIGYIKVSKFGGTTYDEFITAIAKLKNQGCESFIIDLQQNGGGYMGAATMMLNEFLDNGQLIVYMEGRAYPRENIFADGSGSCKENQIVVLMDETSASASEIFGGGIQDHDRGLIVGRRSFGKGLVQSPHVFKDGSAIRLTVARYHTPSGRCVQKVYENGHGEEYSLDLLNRFNRGEFDHKDSIKVDHLPVFHTVGGRTVYGNDGILADVFIPRDTTGVNSYYLDVLRKGLMREFTFDYTERNRVKLKEFKTWEKLAGYLSTQPLVDNLVEYAYIKGVRRRPYLIEESRRRLKTELEALIVRSVGNEDGFYQIYQRDDMMIKKAIQLIKAGKAKPQAVKAQKYK